MRKICPLYAPQDESRARLILEALKKKGAVIREPKAEPGKHDALLLFLSGHTPAENSVADEFFRLNTRTDLVIPVNLDGSRLPETLENALMARHTLDGSKYTADELADRIARAAAGGKKSRLPLILSAAAAVLLLAVGVMLIMKGCRKAEPPVPPDVSASPSPSPYATEEPFLPEHPDWTLEQLRQVHELIIVGDSFTSFNGDEEWIAEAGWARVGAEYVANRTFENGEARWYSAEDGHEYVLYDWGDLSFLSYMQNLKLLTLVRVKGTLPDLSGLRNLDNVELFDCEIGSLSGLEGTGIINFGYDGPAADFSPLTGCKKLNRVSMDLYGPEGLDLSSFSPPGLSELEISGGESIRTADLSGLKACKRLDYARLEEVPLSDLDCFSGATELRSLELCALDFLTSLHGLGSHADLTEIRIDSCPRLSDLGALNSCSGLDTVCLEGCPIQDVSFLAGAGALRKLELRNMGNLRSLHGLEDHANLKYVRANDLRGLTDISALSGCRALMTLHTQGCRSLSDVTPVLDLPRLTELALYGAAINSVDFLRDVRNKEYFSFGITEVDDWEGLSAIEKYGELNLTFRDSRCLEYLRDATVTDLILHDRGGRNSGFTAGMLPRVTNLLYLQSVRSLEGLDQPDARVLILENCPYLSSLSGLEGMPRLVGLEAVNCPRLSDWSALDGRKLDEMELEALFSLPDFGGFEVKNVSLTTIYDLKDLSCFERSRQDGYSISLMDVDGVTDLSPLYHLHGKHLKIPAHLIEQAEAMKNSGLLDSYEVSYPEGWWEPIRPEVSIETLEEIGTLPSALLSHVDRLTLAGDTVMPDEGARIEEDYSAYPPALYICTDGSEDRIPVEPGTLTDLSVLEKLTGLTELAVYSQPLLTSLDGIQAMGSLRGLNIQQCPALTDASAVFTIESLEELRLRFTGVTSIQGIQNLYALRMLDLNDNPVEDLSPIAACGDALRDVSFELPMMTFDELGALPDGVRRFIRGGLSIAGRYVYSGGPWWFDTDWSDGLPRPYLKNGDTGERLPLTEGAVTDMAALAALLPELSALDLYAQPDLLTLDGMEAFSRLRRINVEECRSITDFSALWRTGTLEEIGLRNEPVESISGVEDLKHLVSLNLSGSTVRDFAPLARVDYSYCMSEEYFGHAFSAALDVDAGNGLTYDDYAPLESVPAFWNLNMNNISVDLWLGHVLDKEVHELSCHRSNISNGQIRAFVESHPELESLDLRWNPQLTDLSPLMKLDRLQTVYLSSDMPKAAASLGSEHGFTLEIE